VIPAEGEPQEPLETHPGGASREIQEEADVTSPGLTVADNSTEMAEESGSTTQGGDVEKSPAVKTVLVDPSEKTTDPGPVSEGDPAGQSRYLVQVASFSSENRANALAGELRADNMSVLIDTVERTAGRLHRVRVGPFADHAEADAMVARIQAKHAGLSPRVMDTRPGEPAQVAESFDPMVRWVVQVGSYTGAAAAEAQVARLTLAGLPAFIEKVTSAGSTLYKVRVGPEIDAAKAKALKARLKAEHNIDGFVTTQE
jgi:DedD protein